MGEDLVGHVGEPPTFGNHNGGGGVGIVGGGEDTTRAHPSHLLCEDIVCICQDAYDDGNTIQCVSCGRW